MTKVTDNVKEKLKGAKDKLTSTTKEGAEATKEKMSDAKDKVWCTSQLSTFVLLSTSMTHPTSEIILF